MTKTSHNPSPLVVIEAPGKLQAASKALRSVAPTHRILATGGLLHDLPKDQLGLRITDLAPVSWTCLQPQARDNILRAAETGAEIVIWTDADDAGEWIAHEIAALTASHTRTSRLRTRALSVSAADWEARNSAMDTNAVCRHLARRIFDRVIGYCAGKGLHVGRIATPLSQWIAERKIKPVRSLMRYADATDTEGILRLPDNSSWALSENMASKAMDIPRMSDFSAIKWRKAPCNAHCAKNGPELALTLALARNAPVSGVWREAQAAYMRGETSYHRTSARYLDGEDEKSVQARFDGLFRTPAQKPAPMHEGHGAWIPLVDPDHAMQGKLVSQLCDYWLRTNDRIETRTIGQWMERRSIGRKRSPFQSHDICSDGRKETAKAHKANALWQALLPLASPASIGSHMQKALSWMNDIGAPMSGVFASLQRARKLAPGLLEEDVTQRLAEILGDDDLCVLERVDAALAEVRMDRDALLAHRIEEDAPVFGDLW